MELSNTLQAYSPLIVKLLQGIIYEDDRKAWQELLSYQSQVRDYFGVIGVELHLNEQDGFAYISQPEEYEGEKVPRLMRRIPLSYEVTLLLVILREAIEEFDVQNTDNRKLFLTNHDLKERIEVFFEDRADRVKLLEKFDTYINSVENLGFLKEVQVRASDDDTKTYEVMRIIKAKINNAKLEEILESLKVK
ncbi:MAG: DUF4194 domain-containing protein [Bacteroidota bacterium]